LLQAKIHEDYFGPEKPLSYVGYKKMHPHDNYAVLRLCTKENRDTNKEIVLDYLKNACDSVIRFLTALML
jgi:hypothetical protein